MFNPNQLAELEKCFKLSRYPDSSERAELVELTGLTITQISNWFSTSRIEDTTGDSRSPFPPDKLAQLRHSYEQSNHLTDEARAELKEQTGLSTKQISRWFKNRRGRIQRECTDIQLPEPPPLPVVSTPDQASGIYTVNQGVYNKSIGSLEAPALTEITPGQRDKSLIFHCKIGDECHEYIISNVGKQRIGLRCQCKNQQRCPSTLSLELLNHELVIEIGKKSDGRTKYGFNRDLDLAHLRCISNYKVIPNEDRKQHGVECRRGKSGIKAQLRPVKRAFRYIHKQAAIKSGSPVIEDVIEQIGLYEQLGKDGIGAIVNFRNEHKSINQLIKRHSK